MKKEGKEIEYMNFRQKCSVVDCLDLFFDHCSDLTSEGLAEFDSKERIVRNEVQEVPSSSSSS